MKPSKIRTLVARQLAKSDGLAVGAAATNVVSTIRQVIQSVIPGDFHWWLEMESEIGISVRWVWLGHSAVSYVGGVRDSDITILLALLRDVNWFIERDKAIESVEGYEREALRIAQERRRIKAVGPKATKLKTVEIPEPPPFTLEGKRIARSVGLARAGYESAVEEKQRKQAAESAKKGTGRKIHSYRSDSAISDYALTRSTGQILKYWVWTKFEEKEELMDALCAQPPGSFSHLCVYGNIFDNPDAWREAWISTRGIREAAAEVPAEPSCPRPDWPKPEWPTPAE